jgi:hypothetical protein
MSVRVSNRDTGTSLTGTVLTAGGEPVPNATVEVFITDARIEKTLKTKQAFAYTDRVQTTTTSQDGSFRISRSWDVPKTELASAIEKGKRKGFDGYGDYRRFVNGLIPDPLDENPRVIFLAYKRAVGGMDSIEGPWFGSVSFPYSKIRDASDQAELPIQLTKRIVQTYSDEVDLSRATIWYEIDPRNKSRISLFAEIRTRSLYSDDGFEDVAVQEPTERGDEKQLPDVERGPLSESPAEYVGQEYYPTTNVLASNDTDGLGVGDRFPNGILLFHLPESTSYIRSSDYKTVFENPADRAVSLSTGFAFDRMDLPLPVYPALSSMFGTPNKNQTDGESESGDEPVVTASEAAIFAHKHLSGPPIKEKIENAMDYYNAANELKDAIEVTAKVMGEIYDSPDVLTTHQFGKIGLQETPQPLEEVPTNPNTYDADAYAWSESRTNIVARTSIEVTEPTELVVSGNWMEDAGDPEFRALWDIVKRFTLLPYELQESPAGG